MTMLLRMDDIRAGAFDPYSAASLNSNRFVIQSRPTQTSAGENAMACTVYTASANTSHGMEVRAAFQRLCRQLPRKRSVGVLRCFLLSDASQKSILFLLEILHKLFIVGLLAFEGFVANSLLVRFGSGTGRTSTWTSGGKDDCGGGEASSRKPVVGVVGRDVAVGLSAGVTGDQRCQLDIAVVVGGVGTHDLRGQETGPHVVVVRPPPGY